MSNLDVTVPSLGESITEAVIAKWLKKEGEIVNKDEVIAELETDKVTQEIYSPKTGIIKKILFQEGEEVKIGETIVNIEEKNIDEQKIEEKEVKNSNVSGEQNKIIVPSLGESISEALISKWMKSPGENVKKGEPIVELETDKVTQELYAESSGVLKEILFNEQEEVKIGETIGVIDLIEHQTEDSIGSDIVNTNDPTKDIKEETENEKDLDPTKIKRTSLNNKIGINDLREFIQDVSLSPSARKFINESKNEINNLNTIATNGRVTKESFSNLKLDSGLNAFSANPGILAIFKILGKILPKPKPLPAELPYFAKGINFPDTPGIIPPPKRYPPPAINAALPIGDFAIFLTALVAFFNPFAIPPNKNASLSKFIIPPSFAC